MVKMPVIFAHSSMALKATSMSSSDGLATEKFKVSSHFDIVAGRYALHPKPNTSVSAESIESRVIMHSIHCIQIVVYIY